MPPAPDRREPPVTLGATSLEWLVAQRRTAALQLEALAPRAASHRVDRAVLLRRRLRRIDVEIAWRRRPR
jgi:hypothetical protein